MARLAKHSARQQEELVDPPFDNWTSPAGTPIAGFHRRGDTILLRFPNMADFEIRPGDEEVTCHPVPEADQAAIDTLFYNSIRPLLINHAGGLALHGSACATPHGGLAFIGLSRRGKTTLAGACARAGNPFLTEDVIELQRSGDSYAVVPQRPVLRVFADTADYLRRNRREECASAHKVPLQAGEDLPFARHPARLLAIYVLGPGEAEGPALAPMQPQRALAEIMQHAFVLDVEDKSGLRAHFERLSDLAEHVPVVGLDFPRDYRALPEVVSAVVEHAASYRT